MLRSFHSTGALCPCQQQPALPQVDQPAEEQVGAQGQDQDFQEQGHV